MTTTSNIIEIAKQYAIQCHTETNHTYDGKPYEVHIELVYKFGEKFKHLLPPKLRDAALAACWTHDTIEDCRQTYNDVKVVCGEQIAEITYALTNEKGKSRKERANHKYYEGIRQTPGAIFVKLCDRLANMQYSKNTNSNMLPVYKAELETFTASIWHSDYKEMFDALHTY